MSLEKLFRVHHAHIELIKNIIKIPKCVILVGESVHVQTKFLKIHKMGTVLWPQETDTKGTKSRVFNNFEKGNSGLRGDNSI